MSFVHFGVPPCGIRGYWRYLGMRFVRTTRRVVGASISLTCAVASLACRKDEPALTSRPPQTPAVPNEESVSDTSCRKVGLWTPCAVEDRLVHAGLVVNKLTAPSRYPFFSVAGIAFTIGAKSDQVEVFIYPSQTARERDTNALDSLNAAPKGQRYAYRVQPLLVTSNNLAALVFTLNERSQERMSLALSAGLPPR